MFYKRTFLLNNIVIKEPFFESKHKIDMQIRRFGPPPHVMGQVCPMTCGGGPNLRICMSVSKFHPMQIRRFGPPPHVMGQTCPMTCGGGNPNPGFACQFWTPPRMSWDRPVPWHAGGFEIPKSPDLHVSFGFWNFKPPRMSWDRPVPWHAGGVQISGSACQFRTLKFQTPPACHGTDLSHDMRGGSKSPDLHVSFVFWNFKTPRMSWDRPVPWHAGGFQISGFACQFWKLIL